MKISPPRRGNLRGVLLSRPAGVSFFAFKVTAGFISGRNRLPRKNSREMKIRLDAETIKGRAGFTG
jgi:hypothetical protein